MANMILQKKRDARVGVAIPREMKDALEIAAAQQGVNISSLVRFALGEYLEKFQRKATK